MVSSIQSAFTQIRGFGEYGFPESHAASFALLVYASAWLKCHAPAAFLCALLSSQPMDFYTPSQLVHDARRHGVKVLPADVIVSDWDSTLQGQGPDAPVRLGLSLIRGCGTRSPWCLKDLLHAASDDDATPALAPLTEG
ncbi:hypothetical protein KQH60_09830 [Mycetohabitans sp. B8]|nr:hypothetical protein [Mycetohabitans sp. B8]